MEPVFVEPGQLSQESLELLQQLHTSVMLAWSNLGAEADAGQRLIGIFERAIAALRKQRDLAGNAALGAKVLPAVEGLALRVGPT